MILTFLMISYHHQKERKEKQNVKNILFTFSHSNKIDNILLKYFY